MTVTPQLENGYVKIANEIIDALIRHRIPGEQMQCVLFIVRKTYGFNKKWDSIANSQFVKATGMKKGNVSRAIKTLIDKKIVIKNDNYTIPRYQFNKNYKQWEVLSKKQPVIKKATIVIKSDNKPLSKVMDTKDNKDTITKDKEIYSRVIDYLNLKTGKNYKHTSKETIRFIKARLNAGFTEQDFFTVIDNKCFKWLTDPKMFEFLRPQTLFGTKFETYLQDVPRDIPQQQLKPTTYAQAQDAERRQRAAWLLKEMQNDNNEDGGEGIDKAIPLLPSD